MPKIKNNLHERVRTRKEADSARKEGLRLLKVSGVSVYKTKEEWENETDTERYAWARKARRKLLSRGPSFRMTPSPLEEEEKKIGVMRAMVSMVTKVRWQIKEKKCGPWVTPTHKWEDALGIKRGIVKAKKKIQPKTLEGWEERLKEEKKKGVACTWNR